MDAKLTLKLDKEVIEKAKQYAASQQRSLSRIIESYLRNLSAREKDEGEIEISPFVKSMATGTKLPNDIDYKLEYLEHIKEKHK